MRDGIYNAKIIDYNLDKQFKKDAVIMRLRLKLPTGFTDFEVSLGLINKLYDILGILSSDQLIDQPCLALIEDNSIKTIGNFLYYDWSSIYTNKEELKNKDEQYWLHYQVYNLYREKNL